MKTGQDLIVNGEIILAGPVVADDQAAWFLDSEAYISPRLVREALAAFPGAVTVRISSDGGNAMAGEAIRSILAGHKGAVTLIVEGMAASAASLIFMGSSTREMTSGSFLMIHDPATYSFGNEEQLRHDAGVLGQLAESIAGTYARASGKDSAETRAIMKAETYFSADQSVAEGFATAVVPEDQGAAATMTAVPFVQRPANEHTARRMVADASRKLAARLSQKKPAAGGPPADAAMKEEAEMPKTTPAAAPAATPEAAPAPVMTAPPQQTPPQSAPTPDPVVAERQRVAEIMEMAQPFLSGGQLMQADVNALLSDGTSAADAGRILMTRMAAGVHPVARTGVATITRDEGDTKLEGMIGALMRQSDGPAAEYRGLRLKSLAMHLAGSRRSYSETETIKAGMMSTAIMSGAYGRSDFAYITTEVMNRSLRAAYQRAAAKWQLVTGTPMSAPDFRELMSVRFGADLQMKPVQENGELKSATLVDEAEGLKVERRGRTLNITFEAIVNDDMGVFDRLPTDFAQAARIMEFGDGLVDLPHQPGAEVRQGGAVPRQPQQPGRHRRGHQCHHGGRGPQGDVGTAGARQHRQG